MTNANYIFILIWLAFVAFLANATGGKKTELVNNHYEIRYKNFWAILLLIPILIWTAKRSLYFGDTGAYYAGFLEMPDKISELSAYMDTIQKDEFFYLFSALIKIFITDNRYIYFGIIAAFQLFALYRIYRKYSEEYFLSMFLFIASTDYLSWMFNGMRQFIAVCIMFLAFPLLLKKRYLSTILIVIFASMFHGSALIMIPFIFIVQGKAWNKLTVIFLFAIIIIISFVDRFTDVLDNMLTDTTYKNVVTDWTQWGDDGTNVLRALVYSVPAIISLYGRNKIKAENDSVINICTNMSIVSAGIYIISIFTSGIFIGRVPIYFSLYSYVLLPWEMKHIFSKSARVVITITMIVLYLLFYIYSVFIH